MTKEDRYQTVFRELAIRLPKGGNWIADCGNITAVLRKHLGFYWVGFYFCSEDRLVLGPFQGTPACVFLSLGTGVCSSAVLRKETVIVPDVHGFAGHVACDPLAKSEIAVPLFDAKHTVRGVLDADSRHPNAFDAIDKEFLEQIGDLLNPRWPAR